MDWPEQRRGSDNPRSLFSPEQVERLRERYSEGGVSQTQLARETGASRRTIQRILTGERYRSDT
jgi:DNA-binding XRE family transcriptional regulator